MKPQILLLVALSVFCLEIKGQGGSFTSHLFPSSNPLRSFANLWSIDVSVEGNPYAAAEDSLYQFTHGKWKGKQFPDTFKVQNTNQLEFKVVDYVVYATTAEKGFFKWDSMGNFTHFTSQNSGLSHDEVQILSGNGLNEVLLKTPNELIIFDGQNSWNSIYTRPTNLDPYTWNETQAIFDRQNHVWRSADSSMHQYDQGSWTSYHDPFLNAVSHFSRLTSDSNAVYVSATSKILSFNGSQWDSISCPNNAGNNLIAVSPSDGLVRAQYVNYLPDWYDLYYYKQHTKIYLGALDPEFGVDAMAFDKNGYLWVDNWEKVYQVLPFQVLTNPPINVPLSNMPFRPLYVPRESQPLPKLTSTEQALDTSLSWSVLSRSWNLWSGQYYDFKGDSIVDGITYHKLYVSLEDSIFQASSFKKNVQYYSLVRSEGPKVYVRQFFGVLGPKPDGEEHVYYDFSLQVGDTVSFGMCFDPGDAVVTNIDSVVVGDSPKKRITIEDPFGNTLDQWIEGIGSIYGPLHKFSNSCINDLDYDLLCVAKGGEIIYDHDAWDFCSVSELVSLEPDTGDGIKIYPNPSNGLVNVELYGDWIGGTLSIFDIRGRHLHQWHIDENTVKLTPSVFNTPGLYTVKVRKGSKQHVQKVVVH
ncbi:MAG: T9SS type A sorting domain-containing protein [Bacteroidota bacterium]